MTTKTILKALSQVYYLNREIEKESERLDELKSRAVSISISNSDMPHGSGVSDKVGNYASEIVDTVGILEAKKERLQHELNRLMRCINSIDDSLTRQIFTARFIDGLSWFQVSREVGCNTESNAKLICYRYIESHINEFSNLMLL